MVASMKRLKEELMIESQKCEEAQQAALKSEKRAEELLIALNTLGTIANTHTHVTHFLSCLQCVSTPFLSHCAFTS
jgi:hypothetical protein